MRIRSIVFPLLLSACAVEPRPLPDVLLMQSLDGRGSGVAIAPGWVLTAAHIGLAGAVDHPTLDLALVCHSGAAGSVEFGPAPEFGAPLRAIGWHEGEYLLMTVGTQGHEREMMSCQILPGCSGGAVIDAEGRLVGIVEGVYAHHVLSGPRVVQLAVPHLAWYTPLTPEVLAWIQETIR